MEGEGSSKGSSGSGSGGESSERQAEKSGEAVRSRWSPKPEQILILESIFNSGMVNPPKDETVRIRKLLEKFGAVGDANVFYWFQNRRSRSRRRQRQLQQATLDHHHHQQQLVVGGGGAIPCEQAHANSPAPPAAPPAVAFDDYSLPGPAAGGSFGESGSFFSVPSPPIGFPQIDHHAPPNLNYHSGVGFGGNNISGFITVFINGIATEVPRGPIDIKTLFGEDVILVHSSGVPLPTNEFGSLMQSLQHGESYFLVPKPT